MNEEEYNNRIAAERMLGVEQVRWIGIAAEASLRLDYDAPIFRELRLRRQRA